MNKFVVGQTTANPVCVVCRVRPYRLICQAQSHIVKELVDIVRVAQRGQGHCQVFQAVLKLVQGGFVFIVAVNVLGLSLLLR
jgi:threonine aldolase